MEFPVVLNPDSPVPLYMQLANRIEDAIKSGCLKPGDRLPGTHSLSSSYGISRATAVHAYEELISRKFVQPSTGRGTIVSPELSLKVNPISSEIDCSPLPFSVYGKRLEQMSSTKILTSGDMEGLNFGGGDYSLLPVKLWQRMLARSCHQASTPDTWIHRDPFGHDELRDAVANYLRRQRSVRCTKDSVAVLPESLLALEIIAKLFVDSSKTVAVEEPGFPYAKRVFCAHGAQLHYMPVDEHGLVTAHLDNVPATCNLIYVSPSHQDPTGAVMSMQRRQELLAWADRRNVIVIEDDYDCEFRYSGSTLPSLQGMDQSGRVIHIYTFWKILAPLSAVGTAALPPRLVEPFRRALALSGRNFPFLEQFALANLIREGHLERHLRTSKTLYGKRLRALLHSLSTNFGRTISLNRESSGMHQLVRLPCEMDDAAVLALAHGSGLQMVSTAPYYANERPSGEFLIPFAHLNEESIEAAVCTFAKEILSRSSSRHS